MMDRGLQHDDHQDRYPSLNGVLQLYGVRYDIITILTSHNKKGLDPYVREKPSLLTSKLTHTHIPSPGFCWMILG